jgi:hypothetical protein
LRVAPQEVIVVSIDAPRTDDLDTAVTVAAVPERSPERSLTKPILALLLALSLGLAAGWIANAAVGDESAAVVANRATVTKWIQAVQDEDVGDIARLYSEDATWYDEAAKDEFGSRAGVIMGWAIFGLVDEVVLVEPVAVTDDAAVVRWRFRGAGWEVTGISTLQMTDGVITAETVYYNAADGP